jgi:signal transduction histidine kinase
MHTFDEMKRYVGFDEQTDGARLRKAWPLIAAHRGEVVDRFYEPILRTPAARAVLKDEAQVERLKATLDIWVEQLFLGPWDDAYYARRERIGRKHVVVGLPSRFMFTAMHAIRSVCLDIVARSGHDDLEVCRSIDRVTSLDLAIMTGTYVEGREAEAVTVLQKLIVSHLPVTVLLIDHARRVTAATRADILSDGDLVGTPVIDAFPAAVVEAAQLAEALARAIDTRREITLPRVDVPSPTGPRSFRFNLVPLEHPEAAALIHVEELTQAIETEARMRRNEALATLGTLSATVAHELRNPLAGISGAVQVISRSLPEEDRRRPIMQKVEDQIKRLNVLVTDLLAFARPAPARLQVIDLAEVARGSVDILAREHPSATLRVVGEGTAYADPNLVQHVVINLVQNAVQAVEGPATVEIRVSAGAVLIADDGPGIPDELCEQVFSPFFTTKLRGSGLGLAISQKAATSMGGSLTLVPGPLRGAAFRLELRQRV